ncbi:MAG: hypothetical protein P1U34_08630 [Coxiellaceae bacterium]|nr:hypothetical protein [Coxiellaceae bacterium]
MTRVYDDQVDVFDIKTVDAANAFSPADKLKIATFCVSHAEALVQAATKYADDVKSYLTEATKDSTGLDATRILSARAEASAGERYCGLAGADLMDARRCQQVVRLLQLATNDGATQNQLRRYGDAISSFVAAVGLMAKKADGLADQVNEAFSAKSHKAKVSASSV